MNTLLLQAMPTGFAWQFFEEKKHNDWEEQRHLEREVMKGIDTSGLEKLQ